MNQQYDEIIGVLIEHEEYEAAKVLKELRDKHMKTRAKLLPYMEMASRDVIININGVEFKDVKEEQPN